MKIKQTIRNVFLGVFLAFGLVVATTPLTAFAADCGVDANGNPVETSIIDCDATGVEGAKGTGLWQLLIIAINILTAGVAVLALAGIIYGSILYTSSGGNTEQVKKAYTIFTNVVIGVVAFAGMWALLNFLVPGGVFNGPAGGI